MTTTTYTFFEKTIIDNIDLESYELSNDGYLYDKIKTVYNIFKSEYVHDNNKHMNEQKLFADWLQGLPSVLTVPFYYHDILKNVKDFDGRTFATEKQEDYFLNSYWTRLSNAFFTLKENL